VTTRAAPSAIAANLTRVRERLNAACERANRNPEAVTLIAVSKTWPAEAVVEAIRAGVTDFGENRVQEAVAKVAEVTFAANEARLPTPRWHLIGHLQTNKVRDALRVFSVIHSVGSERAGAELRGRCATNAGGEPPPVRTSSWYAGT
jgi:PLP dependent protein